MAYQARSAFATLLVLGLFLTGCETLSGSSDASEPEAQVQADADTVDAPVDTSRLDPRVVRLYRLEAELLAAAGDSAKTGRLLNQAMAELAALLQASPDRAQTGAGGVPGPDRRVPPLS